MNNEPLVYIVDDDEGVRNSLQWLVQSAGMQAERFASAHEFLAGFDPQRRACLVLDLRMPDLSGLELQQQLSARGVPIPIIMISGHGTVPSAVQAMKGGAIDFLQKPFDDAVLLERIRTAFKQDEERRRTHAQRAEIAQRVALLSPREREVMGMVVQGMVNKQIAARLGLSPKTVEIHRGHMMKKMRAESVAELVRLAGVVSPQDAQPLLPTAVE
ncbi:MAG: response regulator transcription factor [Planctomycetes bacterium]|nr:response regulator transcription factor [Planctomycetota bacterium]